MADETVDIPQPIAPAATDHPDPNQAPVAPPPLPEGATSEPPSAPPLPEGASATPPDTESGQDKTGAAGLLQYAENVGVGVAKGAESTAEGVGSLIHKIPGIGPKIVPGEGLQAMQKQATPEGTDQWVGYGGENLAEFMLGDEALKGLSMADKFKQISGVMGIFEKSPRLMKMLQMGVDVGKAQTELGPEEQAAIKKSPMLARLVGVGMDALRQGAVQGAQTLTKTGGDVGAAAKQGTETGVASGVLGGAFGLLGRAVEKAGATGEAVKAASEAGAAAPSKLDMGAKVADQINSAEQQMHGDFETGIQKLKGDLGDQKVPYQGSPLQKAAKETLEGITDKQVIPGKEEATGLLDASGQPLTKTGAEKTVRTTKGVLGEGLKNIAGGSQQSRNLLNDWADQKKTGNLTIDDLVQARQQLGEKIGVLTRGGTSSADRADVQVYQKLRDGIDDTIDALAKNSGKPEASQDYEALRGAYKDKVKLFQSPAIQALSAPGIDSATKLDNASKYLLSGGNKLDKVNTLTQVIGEPGVKDLGKGIVGNLLSDASSDSGQINPAKFVKNFKQIDNLPPEVKDKLFDANTIQGGLDKLAGDLKTAANYQKLVRAGVLSAVGSSGAAIIPHGGLGILLGLAGAGELGPAGDILDKIANRPGMWSAFRTAGKIGAAVEASPAARRVGTAAKYGAGNALGNILQGAQAPLSQPEDQGRVVYTNQ